MTPMGIDSSDSTADRSTRTNNAVFSQREIASAPHTVPNIVTIAKFDNHNTIIKATR
jgi:hypothetical protein